MRVLLIFTLALAWRLAGLVHYKMIDSDGAYYGSVARFFADGHWTKALDPTWPPLFPFAASLFCRLGFSLEASGIVVSIISSAAIVLPCYYLARMVAGERAGLAAAVIAALHPRLLVFSQSYLAEALYVFLSSSSLAIFCHAFNRLFSNSRGRRGDFWIFIAIGILIGLSFLARPEGFVYFLLFLMASMGALLFGGRSGTSAELKRRANSLLPITMVMGFLITVFPYLYNVHKIEGRWVIGGKAGQSFYSAYSKAYREEGIEARPSDYASITGPETMRKPGDYKVMALIRKSPGIIVVRTVKNIPKALFEKIPGLMYWPLMLLSIWGMLFRKRVARSRYELLLGAWIGVCVLTISPLFLFRRYFAVTIVPLIVWGAIGVEEIRAAISRKAFLALVFIFVVSLLAYGNHTLAKRSKPILYKEAGLYLKKQFGRAGLPVGDRLASEGRHGERARVLTGRKPETSFYAESEYRPLRSRTMDELPAFFDYEAVTHLVVDDYIMQITHPGLMELLEPSNAPSWLKEVFSSARNGHKIVVYQYVPD